MGSKNQNSKKYHKQKPKPNKKVKGQQEVVPKHWTFPKLDKFFSKRLNLFFYISIVLTILLGAYLFDLKVSEGGDDSDYIIGAKHFLTGESFPTWHGSFYPIFLSLFIAIFGVNLFVLKLVSFICIVLHLIVFFYAFRREIAPTFLVVIMLILGVNSHILYYASQTYSEAFFMMLQMVNALLLFKIIDINLKDNVRIHLNYWKHWLSLGLFTFFIFQTRNIGIAMLLAIIVFFALEQRYVHALFSILGFLVFAIPFKLYKNIVWNMGQANLAGQYESMFYKNPYNPSLGKVNFSEMLTRVIENSEVYLSRHLMIILGFRPEGSREQNVFLAILIVAILVSTLILAYNKNRKMFFVLLYSLTGIAATFVSVQVLFGQPRLILIYVPFILVSLSWLVNYLYKRKSIAYLRFILLGIFGFVFIKTLSVTTNKIDDHKKVLKENIEGNKYYGFTPDWVHFLAMSEWAGKNISDSAVIASRKPSMSSVYSNGRDFYGIFKFPTYPVDTLLQEYNERFEDLTIVNLNSFMERKVPTNIQFAYHLQSLAYVYDERDIFGVFKLRNARRELKNSLEQHEIEYWNDVDTLISYTSKGDYTATSPDSLLFKLKQNSVDYIIRGNLRVNPRKKTDRIINTVSRYMYFIELKYPGIFQEINQIGADENEPAHLFKVNYHKYHLK